MALTVDSLLQILENDRDPEKLLKSCGPDVYPDLWDKDPKGPQLYRAFANTLIKRGFATFGLKYGRRGLEAYARDPELLYTIALAHSRGGNLTSAAQTLDKLLNPKAPGAADQPLPQKVHVEALAMLGKLNKARYRSSKNDAERRQLAQLSAEGYQQAALLPGADTFPLVNAATMWRLQGNIAESRKLASQAVARLLPQANSDDIWTQATLGEAYVLIDDHEAGLIHYKRAADLMFASRKIGDLITMLGNLQLLAEAGVSKEPAWLQERLGSIVLFSGHRIDPPQWLEQKKPPRFPNDSWLAGRVEDAIGTQLEKLNARFGFCSLASGSDILFAEAMLARHAELHVVLPFAKKDFLYTSVDYGYADDPSLMAWRHRFEAVIARLPEDHLHYATSEPYLGTDLLYEYANTYMRGLAVVRANQCLLNPIALVVLDPASEAGTGGTRSFLEDWQKSGRQAEVIDLAKLRLNSMQRPALGKASAPPETTTMPRTIRSMLFADVAEFSKLREEMAPAFFTDFTVAVAEVLAAAGKKVLLVNSWGDGIFAVFAHVADCADFALRLIDQLKGKMPWIELGFHDTNPVRVGLHAGPVFELPEDPILRRRNFFGQHVNRTARIEPVTMPGNAFASEQFAALLTLEAPNDFRCELIGIENLAKKYASAVLYRISRM